MQVSIDSKLSGWNSGFGLDSNVTYQIRPSAATQYTINGGATQADFHGEGDMDGNELGIPAQVRVGGLAVLVWHHRSGGAATPQIITFPPGKDFDSVTIGPDGGSMHFVITDRAGTYGDNSGSCNVEIISTKWSAPELDSMKQKLEEILKNNLAQGNAGSAEIQQFDYDGNTNTIQFRVKIHHEQDTDLPLIGRITDYAVDTFAQGSLNLSDISSISSLEVCVGKPGFLGGGAVCVTLTELAALIAAL
jgi:hypothetical protein